MKKYIGTKMLEATPMTRGDYNKYRGWQIPENENPADEGYLVKYSDGYESWSPKKQFEVAYLEVQDNPNLPSGVSIGLDMVEAFIKDTEVFTIGEKNTVVRAMLINGFEIIESSACVDERNYSEEIGAQICLERIHGKIWELLGFLLQTAWHGIK